MTYSPETSAQWAVDPYRFWRRRPATRASGNVYRASIDKRENQMLLRIVLAGLAVAAAGLGVALSLSLTPSGAIVRSLPRWESTEMLFPRASDNTPASSRPTDAANTTPHAVSARDVV